MSFNEKISKSLIGKFGNKSRRWKGEKAGYVAKHMWISKHYKKPSSCEQCKTNKFTRLEWSNISGKYLRERNDYKALCPSCHRKNDLLESKTHCPHGHEYNMINTYITPKGHRDCRICRKEANRRYKNAKRN